MKTCLFLLLASFLITFCSHNDKKTKQLSAKNKIIIHLPEKCHIYEQVAFQIDTPFLIDSVKISCNNYFNVIPFKNEKLIISPLFWMCGENDIYFHFFTNGQCVEKLRKTIKALPDSPPKPISYKVSGIYPHDSEAYTQGLFFYNGFLYESTGKKGNSTVRIVDPLSGKLIQQRNIDSRYFCEGIALLGNKLYQLTWQNRTGFIYDANTLGLISEFYYPTEGWGLTTNGHNLIMSDGSEKIYFMELPLMECRKILNVYDQKGPVKNLNELELVDNYIFANIYYQDIIVAIDTLTGAVVYETDCSKLRNYFKANNAEVLNGIAYNKEKNRFYLTGKYWPVMFEAEMIKQ